MPYQMHQHDSSSSPIEYGDDDDKVGNRSSKTVNGITTTYRYDVNDRLLDEKVNETAIVTYGYDNNGSTIDKTENGLTSSYVWNDDKRLVSATVNGKAIGYTYNDQGIRVSSTVDGVETRYLLDEGITANVWEEYSPNGTVQASYVYGNDLISQVRSGVSSFYLVDGLGSTRLLTDSQGQVLNAYGYEAVGETMSQSGTATNAYQYAGEQFDGAIGDYYLRQRFYDPSSGRFGRMDTYEGSQNEPLTLHKYSYAHNNSVNGTDPTGLFMSMADVSVAHSIANSLIAQYVRFTADFVIDATASRGPTPELREAAAFAKGLLGAFDAIQNAVMMANMMNALWRSSGGLVGSAKSIMGISSSGSEFGKISQKAATYRGVLIKEGVGRCDTCAQNIAGYMKSNKIPGSRIRVKDSRRGKIYSDSQGLMVSNNGFHDAIITKVDGKIQVIDNIHPNPVPIQQWFNDLYFENGIKNVSKNSLNFEVLDSWGKR